MAKEDREKTEKIKQIYQDFFAQMRRIRAQREKDILAIISDIEKRQINKIRQDLTN